MVFRSRWWGAGSGAAGVLGAFEFVYSPNKAAARQEIEEQRRRTVPVPAPGDGPRVEFGPDPVDGAAGPFPRFAARVVLRRPAAAAEPSASEVSMSEPAASAQREQSTSVVDVIE